VSHNFSFSFGNLIHTIIQESDGQSVLIRFARKATSGAFSDNKILLGMIEALTLEAERGLEKKNVRYNPDYDEFCNVIRMTSPAAFRTLCQHFPARGERSFQYVVK